VRIAILDTGVDTTHPKIQAARDENRIMAYYPEFTHPTPDYDSESTNKSLDSNSNSLHLCRDQHGHGTHGTSVLLRTALNTSLYIAKVTDDDGNLRDQEIVKVHIFAYLYIILT
jgi:subtilisin family serine protease